MTAKKSASLTFANLHTVQGMLEDGKGNEFNIYISGEKKEVDKFIRYQKRQLAKGIFGIFATVTHDDSSEHLDINNKPRPKRNSKVEFKSGRVKIAISRHKIVVKRPYTITYRIDPKIKTAPETIALNTLIQPVPD